jgi:aminoglycoside phosphotransferase (APT) family kinase protein
MGGILADIHRIDFSALGLTDDYYRDERPVDWNSYLRRGIEAHAPWLDVYKRNSDNLYSWNDRLISAAQRLSSDSVISHGDLEPKNVMWCGDEPIIIDWEAAGFISSMHDLVETALYWSVNNDGKPDKNKFTAFVAGYGNKGGVISADWQTILDKGFGGKLGWLEYSLKRALGIECADEAERQMGAEHVVNTLQMLREYDGMKETIIEWLSV